MGEFFEAISKYLEHVANYNLAVVIVELFLIGLIVWWVTRFLRGTRGARLVKGMVLLLACLYIIIIRLLPRNWGNVTLEWGRLEFLFGKFLLFSLVAAMVAFQPELRRALIQIGQTRFFQPGIDEVEQLVDALVNSIGYLGRNKIGALIAVERTVGLGALVESGTTIDSEATSALLNTIFYPGSVLHDMGVIISNGRVAAAGCQFPLAESEDVDPSLGSRHRAALGLAQESDSVVLVVSEETGRFSLACEGQLYIGLELDNFREMLFELLATKRAVTRKRKLRKAESAEPK